MNWQYTPLVLPLLLAAATSLAVAYSARRRRYAPGTTAFVLLMLAVAEWTVGYALELGSTGLPAKLFWAKVEYAGIVTLPVAWLVFAMHYTRRGGWLARRPQNLAWLALVPAITLALVWTNEYHGLIWSQTGLNTTGPFPSLALAYGPWFWVHSAYSYLLLFVGTAWLITMLIRSPHLYRRQAWVLVLGVLAPWIGNGLYLFEPGPIANVDLTPFAFTLSGLIFAWGLLRFRLLDIVPVARRTVIDSMHDGVMVLDTQNRIVDLNPAAQHILGIPAAGAIGRPAAQVLTGYADLVERYRNVTEARSEITLHTGNALRHYDLHISPLTGRQGQPIGRVIMLHDITARKQAEEALRNQKQLFESLVAVARATTGQPGLEATLQNALNVATSLTRAELGSLILLDEHGHVTHHISALEHKTSAQARDYLRQVMDTGLAGWVFRRQQPVLITDTTRDNRWLPLPDDHPTTVNSALAVPIRNGNIVLGVLTLAHPAKAHFHVEHLELMDAAADQMALAVQNAQIFEAQRQMADRQITLFEVLRSVAGQTNLEHVVRMAVETISQFAGWPNVLIALPDEEGAHWTAQAVSGTLAAIAGQTFPMQSHVLGRAFQTAKTQLVLDVSTEPESNLSKHPDVRSVLVVPLRRGSRILGLLGIESCLPAAFDAEDVMLAESLAEAVALTLDNARLHAETRRRLKEQTALRQAGAAISASLDLETVLSLLAEQLGQVVDATSALIFNYNPETTTATVLAEYFSPEAVAAERVSALNTTYRLQEAFPNLLGLLRTGQPGLNHITNPYLPPVQKAHMEQFGLQTTLTIPLQLRGETIAFAELRESRRRREFAPDQIALCQAIAQQAAIAIEQARFYDEARQHAAGLSALYTVTRMVSQSLALEDILPKALSSVLISLGFEAGIITLADPLDGKLRPAADYGLPSFLSKHMRENNLNGSLCHYVYTRQEIVTIDDLRRQTPVDATGFVALGLRTFAGIPLMHGRQSLGSLSLFSRRPRPVSPDEAALLTTIGNQIAVAVANARLFQTVAGERSRLQALLESSRDGVILVGMDRRVLVTNAPALALLKLPGKPADWTGRPIMEALKALRSHAPAAVKATLAEMRRIRRGDEPLYEDEYNIPPRTIHWLNLPVQTGDTPLGRLIVLRDVTEERLLEKMRDDLTHTMVHDLRNPLTAISGSLQLVNKVGGTLLPVQQQMLDIARNRAQTMMELVNGILDVSRLESGRMPLERSRVSPAELVAAAVQAQSPLAADKNLNLQTTAPNTLPPVWVDAQLVNRVLQNLLGNAIKFTPPGGRIQITAEPGDAAVQLNGCTGCVRISVSDTGPGIPPELHSRLFQKFATGLQEGSGSGLGLAFCKLAVEAHGGRIWVDSEPGHGATFTFTLPVTPATNRKNGAKRQG